MKKLSIKSNFDEDLLVKESKLNPKAAEYH